MAVFAEMTKNTHTHCTTPTHPIGSPVYFHRGQHCCHQSPLNTKTNTEDNTDVGYTDG